MVDQVPNQVWVTFSDALDPTSSISVHLAAIESPSGELSFPNRQVSIHAGRDPGDRSGRSLRAELVPGLPAGLYRVAWKTVAQNERALVAGTFCFGVGISDRLLRGLGGSLREREPGSLAEPDSKRAMLLITGLLFVGVAAALPWLLRRTDWRS